jgi:hypothetical protein
MSVPLDKSKHERLVDSAAIEAALKRLGREVVLAHARAGRSVPSWENGKVVWVSPEEILSRFSK